MLLSQKHNLTMSCIMPDQVSARPPKPLLIQRVIGVRADEQHSPGANAFVDERDDELQHFMLPY
jgi:hypothetical protein